MGVEMRKWADKTIEEHKQRVELKPFKANVDKRTPFQSIGFQYLKVVAAHIAKAEDMAANGWRQMSRKG